MTLARMPPNPVLLGRLALAAILLLAAGLRWWQLGQNGFGRQYYAAGVRSMLGSWHNFFFNAFARESLNKSTDHAAVR